MQNDLLWGIDLGGTKIEGVVVSRANPEQPKARLRVDTQAEYGAVHILSQIEKLVRMLEKQSGAKPARIGVGTPGTIDPALDVITNSNTLCLNGRAFSREIPTRLMNDANCFALAEQRPGAAKGKSNVFGIILGTGVGGGLVINGILKGGHVNPQFAPH